MTSPSLGESDVTAACDKLARDYRWSVESYSDKRKVRTHVGLPDRRYTHSRGLRIWVEIKGNGKADKLTREQHEWLTAEYRAGGLVAVVDDVAQLRRLFTDLQRDAGRGAAMAYGWSLVEQSVAKGYRGERKAA